MSFNQIVIKNLRRNIRHYSMYVFSITMSVMLFFGFVTLRYSEDLNSVQSGIRVGAAIKVGVTILTIIIVIFLLYANKLFIKRRSREIGLYQLIGMTKREVFKIFALENFVLFTLTAVIGSILGFFSSKILLMILYKIIGIQQEAHLNFSIEAFIQTIVLMIAIYIIIAFQNAIFIKRKTILALMHEYNATDTKIKKIKLYELIFGAIGIVMIISGYYLSSVMFDNLSSAGMTTLYIRMLTILFLTIVGAYLLFRCSISLIFNTIRKYKKGMLSVTDVVSTSSIMHKMKTNALSLTIIAIVSAMSVGLLALSYVQYYNAEETARSSAPDDYIFVNKDANQQFKKALDAEHIQYKERNYGVTRYIIDDRKVLKNADETTGKAPDSPSTVAKASEFKDLKLKDDEVAIVGYSDILDKVITVNDEGKMSYKMDNQTHHLKMKSISKESYLATIITYNAPVYVVSDHTFDQMKKHEPKNDDLNQQYGVNLTNDKDVKKAEKIFSKVKSETDSSMSYYEIYNDSKSGLGVMLFILGFLGIAFLLSTGCIIYIKQIDETEDETSNYIILRKLGYTSKDMSKGIALKIGFNFALPLIIGLCHGYFAAKSAWFFMGQSFYTPVLIVMSLYSLIYILFAFLAYIHSKRVIQRVL
ncbi:MULTISPECIES: FtsX-like permease family protein [Mammaliicoccus]|uniref:FtsX-like permease family protein n=1 Tax=Mammaliicoccus TaxID=2803850 RepID=UPI000D1D7754|nr:MULTISPECIES: FtsX-like permease family protein [Mammaliicoccus]MBO1219520.1 ABC transporter permease [Mammaliicoccus sciuri]MBO1232723.1 ABC transporter permease [Mammaliicoccus sciuri]MDQ7131537.1 ABC transporter permease [Mammaliicoccus sciuri]PTJ81088.1 ABC transporter permease [Mammaliicoccus sciuri]PTK02380.1 ABC transporter permease [Mammaliicoccus sciuri]